MIDNPPVSRQSISRQWIPSLCIVALMCGCQSQVLFDGSDLEHWTGLGRNIIPSGHWVIEGTSLHKVAGARAPAIAGNEPGYGGDLRSNKRYLNFSLCFDFKLAKGANSGVKYNVSEQISAQHGHPSAAIGFEFQVLDDANHPDATQGRDGNRTVASLYDIYPAAADKPVVRPNEWHRGCVLADGDRIVHSLDDKPVLEYDVGSADFLARVAASKFAAIENFSTRRAGYIVLQDHFDDVWYRNIRIRELKPSN